MIFLSKRIAYIIILFTVSTLVASQVLAGTNAETDISYRTVLNPWPSNVAVKTYPPEAPPSNPNELGQAKWNVKASRGKGEDGFKYEVDKNGNIKVLKIATATLTVKAEILMPAGYTANSRLHRHEKAHMKISKYEWENKARKKLRRQMRKFRKELKKKMKAGTLKVPKGSKRKMAHAAKKLLFTMMSEYLKKAEMNITKQMQTLSNAYDIATDSNKDTKVDPDKAADEVIKSREKLVKHAAKAKKKKQLKPSNKVTTATGSGTVEKKPEGLKINKTTVTPNGGGGLFEGGFWDPNYRAIPLGPDEDQEDDDTNDSSEQHNMGDYIFEFTDPGNPELRYAWAIAYDMKYSPCDYNGHASYIQVALSILPHEFNGVNTTMPDPWIDEIEAAVDANDLICAWYYFPEPLYDEDGNWLPTADILPYELIIGAAQDSGVNTIDSFSYIDPGMMNAEWMPFGTVSFLELGSQGYFDDRSMAITFDNIAAPGPAEVQRIFAPPIDLTIDDPQLLEVWVNTLETDPNCFNNMYIALRDMGGITRQASVTLDESVKSISDYDDEWTSIAVKLDDPILAGLELNQIESISIGIMDQGFGPYAGTILIDEVRTHDQYIIGTDEMDFNYDGYVDILDLAAFTQSWLEHTTWP